MLSIDEILETKLDRDVSYREAKNNFDRHWLEKTMQDCKYNQSKAANRMGLSRGCLRMKLREHFGNKYFRDAE